MAAAVRPLEFTSGCADRGRQVALVERRQSVVSEAHGFTNLFAFNLKSGNCSS